MSLFEQVIEVVVVIEEIVGVIGEVAVGVIGEVAVVIDVSSRDNFTNHLT